MSVLPVGIAASGDVGYTLDNSLRFRSSASAYLTRTPSSAGNRKTFTISFWHKKAKTAGFLFAVRNSSGGAFFALKTSSDTFNINDSQNSDHLNLTTTQVFRDVSAWYHIVVAIDTTQATSSDRAKLYVNGEQVTSFSTSSYPAQNADMMVNSTIGHYIGCSVNLSGTPTLFIDAYLTEINFIDGQALDPTDFGEFDATTGVWKPKAYSGTYGTNGFYLDGSGVTDSSGNGNNWTANNMNLSTSSATTYDLMTDVPTLTDENTANYCTLNPLDKNTSATISNGNLTQDASASAWRAVRSTYFVSSGKWYWEATVSGSGSDIGMIGISNSSATLSSIPDANAYGYNGTNGQKYTSSSGTAYGASYSNGDVIGIALDMDAGTLTFYKNNISQGTAYSSLSGLFSPTFWQYAGYTWNVNFGQRPLAYTPPTGFLPLNTYNLPDSTIVDGSKHFNTVLYNGNGSTQSITGVGFQPDLVWVKGRNNAGNHLLADTVRGALKSLASNTTNAETDPDTNGLTSFDVDGFSAGSATRINGSGNTYVGWNWKANGSGSSNTDGTASNVTVSANTTSGFSVVTYTGSPGDTVGHGLGVAPKMIIQKDRDNSVFWRVFHYLMSGSEDYNPTDNLHLNTTNAYPPGVGAATRINGVNATTFTNTGGFTASEQLAYCFASVEGFSAFGKYTGNGSADGPFIYTGFRPAWIMVKRTSAADNWWMQDNARDPYNVAKHYLSANTTNAEFSNLDVYDYTANGFKIRTTTTAVNASGSTYIYAAFAENPFKNSLAR